MTRKLDAGRAAYAPTLRIVKPDAAEATRAAIRRAIEEVLSNVAIVDVRNRLMNHALQRAGLGGPPVSRIALRYFIEGPLYETLVEVLGGDTSDALLWALRDVAERAATSPTPTSGVRTVSARPPRARARQTARTKGAIPRLRPSIAPR
jgi:hypothetical protein